MSTAIDRPPIGSTVIGAGTKSTTWCRSDTGWRSASGSFWCRRSVSRAAPQSAQGPSWPARSAWPGTSPSARAFALPHRRAFPIHCRTRPSCPAIPPSTTGIGSRRRRCFAGLPALRKQVHDLQRRLETLEGAAPDRAPDLPPDDVAALTATDARPRPAAASSPLPRPISLEAGVRPAIIEAMTRMLARPVAAAVLAVGVVAGVFEAPSAATSVRPTAFKFDDYTLPNGLRVILLEDHSTPIVHVTLWYHVGSKDEKTGRTGFAHLFEHMMFKGSTNVPARGAHLVHRVGRWAEQRLHHRGHDRVLANRPGAVPAAHAVARGGPDGVTAHRGRHVQDGAAGGQGGTPAAGREPAVRQPLRDHLRHRVHDPPLQAPGHRQHGRPRGREHRGRARVPPHLLPSRQRDAGDRGRLRSSDAKSLVEREFSKVAKPTGVVPRNIPQEPARTKELRVTIEEDWPLPAVVVAYPITYDGHPDSYPLHIAAKVLSDGTSSRIYQRLVYKERLALSAFGQANLIENPNLFYAVAIVAPGHTPEQVTKALDRGNGPAREASRSPTRELERSKNQFARDYVLGRQTVQNKATHPRARGRPAQGRHRHRRRRVRHLPEHDGRRGAARGQDLLHAAEPDGAHGDATRAAPRRGAAVMVRSMQTLWVAVVAILVAVTSPLCAQERPPRPLEAHDIKIPPYEVRTLPNGLRVVVVSQHEQPAVSLRMLVKAGSAQDPPASPAWPRWWARCWIRAPPSARPSRSPTPSTTWAVRSGPAPAPTSRTRTSSSSRTASTSRWT